MVYALVKGDRRIGTRLRMTILQTHMKIGKKKPERRNSISLSNEEVLHVVRPPRCSTRSSNTLAYKCETIKYYPETYKRV